MITRKPQRYLVKYLVLPGGSTFYHVYPTLDFDLLREVLQLVDSWNKIFTLQTQRNMCFLPVLRCMFTGFEIWTFSQALKVLHVIKYYGSSFKQDNLHYYTYEVQCSDTGRGVESRGMAKYHLKSMETNFIVLIFIFQKIKFI